MLAMMSSVHIYFRGTGTLWPVSRATGELCSLPSWCPNTPRAPVCVLQRVHETCAYRSAYTRLVRYCSACTARTRTYACSSACTRLFAVLCVRQRVLTHLCGRAYSTLSTDSFFRISVLHDASPRFVLRFCTPSGGLRPIGFGCVPKTPNSISTTRPVQGRREPTQ